MSTNAPAAAIAPAQEAASAPSAPAVLSAANDALIAPAAIDPARTEIQAPEQTTLGADQTAIVPPTGEVKIPTAPIHAVAPPNGTAANDTLRDTAAQIEKQLAQYVGQRLPAELAKGLLLDVLLANSNAVTGHAGQHNEYDLLLNIKGGAFTPERHKAIEQILKGHPAFSASKIKITQTSAPGNEYSVIAKSLALNASQITELLKTHPVPKGTPIVASTEVTTHVCKGSACQHDHAPQAASDSSTAVTITGTTPPEVNEPVKESTPATPVIKSEADIAAPAVADVPSNAVEAAAAVVEGKAAANDNKLAIGA